MKQAMRERVVWLWMLMGIAMAAMGQPTTSVSEPIKVMTYNVRHCAGMDLVVDYDRTAEVILRQQPDVVALQELDSVTGRSRQCDQLNELARRTGYIPVFGGAIDYDGGKYGVGVLCSETPLSTKRIPLPGEEPRILLVVELKDYVITCTHLDLELEARMASVPIIMEEAKQWKKPFLLVGDWNDTPDSELVCELQRAFTILSSPEVSYPADQPLECLDYVASYKNRKTWVLKSVVIDEPEASDHRPVVVTLQVLAPILY